MSCKPLLLCATLALLLVSVTCRPGGGGHGGGHHYVPQPVAHQELKYVKPQPVYVPQPQESHYATVEVQHAVPVAPVVSHYAVPTVPHHPAPVVPHHQGGYHH